MKTRKVSFSVMCAAKNLLYSPVPNRMALSAFVGRENSCHLGTIPTCHRRWIRGDAPSQAVRFDCLPPYLFHYYWSSLAILMICSKYTRSSYPLYPSFNTSTSTASIDEYTFFIFPRHSFSGCTGSWSARNTYTITIPACNSGRVVRNIYTLSRCHHGYQAESHVRRDQTKLATAAKITIIRERSLI